MDVEPYCALTGRSANGAKVALHVVDPFKVHVEEAVIKARFLAEMHPPATRTLVIGSTDIPEPLPAISAYVAKLRKEAPEVRYVTHFPPSMPEGHPLVTAADAVLATVVLNSRSAFFAAGSLQATLERAAQSPGGPVLIRCAAITFGTDGKSWQAVRAAPVQEDDPRLPEFAGNINTGQFAVVYLFSRMKPLGSAVIRCLRSLIAPRVVLIASGHIASRAQVREYWGAGADCVVIGSALERPDWRQRMSELLPTL